MPVGPIIVLKIAIGTSKIIRGYLDSLLLLPLKQHFKSIRISQRRPPHLRPWRHQGARGPELLPRELPRVHVRRGRGRRRGGHERPGAGGREHQGRAGGAAAAQEVGCELVRMVFFYIISNYQITQILYWVCLKCYKYK